MSLTLQKNNSFKGFYTAINQADDFIGRLFFLSWELYHDVCLVGCCLLLVHVVVAAYCWMLMLLVCSCIMMFAWLVAAYC
ncbi:hypothetical protein V6N12_020370 [Hibiscus sabdariffa]|uniref:ABC transmembrane type-1 domain-containing protein n=1 Tax=Hibiscus sabdariffa TaxID=183260 RepID=A0ABR2B3I1_9ROSI